MDGAAADKKTRRPRFYLGLRSGDRGASVCRTVAMEMTIVHVMKPCCLWGGVLAAWFSECLGELRGLCAFSLGLRGGRLAVPATARAALFPVRCFPLVVWCLGRPGAALAPRRTVGPFDTHFDPAAGYSSGIKTGLPLSSRQPLRFIPEWHCLYTADNICPSARADHHGYRAR